MQPQGPSAAGSSGRLTDVRRSQAMVLVAAVVLGLAAGAGVDGLLAKVVLSGGVGVGIVLVYAVVYRLTHR